MRIVKLPLGLVLTVWWWAKSDKRQKKPTAGFGFIVEHV